MVSSNCFEQYATSLTAINFAELLRRGPRRKRNRRTFPRRRHWPVVSARRTRRQREEGPEGERPDQQPAGLRLVRIRVMKPPQHEDRGGDRQYEQLIGAPDIGGPRTAPRMRMPSPTSASRMCRARRSATAGEAIMEFSALQAISLKTYSKVDVRRRPERPSASGTASPFRPRCCLLRRRR